MTNRTNIGRFFEGARAARTAPETAIEKLVREKSAEADAEWRRTGGSDSTDRRGR